MTADVLRKELKFAAVVIFGAPSAFYSFIQIVCDLASSTNGHLLGPKRTAKNSQFTKVIMTDPDFLTSTEFPTERFATGAVNEMVEAVFRRRYGYEMEIE